MRWIVVLLIVAALGAGYGLGVLSQGDSDGAAGRAKRSKDSLPVSSRPSLSNGATVASSLTDVPIPELPKGDGVITGSVFDEADAPVAGVLVVGQPVRNWQPRKVSKAPGAPNERSIDELVREWAGAELWRRKGAVRATTDEDGQYALSGLSDLAYRITAYKKGALLRPKSQRQAYNVRAPAEVHFIAGSVVRVPVDVVMGDGSQPKHAQITIMSDMPGGGRTGTGDSWTPAQPWIEVSPGTYGMYASLHGVHQMNPKEVRVVVSAEVAPETVKLTIVIKPALRLTVVPPDGFDPLTVRALILRVHGGRIPEDAELLQSRDIHAWPAGEGIYEFRDLEPGRYLVGASASYSSPIVASKVVDVLAGTVSEALQFPAPDAAAHYIVRAVGPGGETPISLSWRLQMESERRSSSRSGGKALRRNDGVFFVPVPAEHDDPEAKHFVTAQSAEWGNVRSEVKPSSTDVVSIVFQKPGFVDATIAGYVGSGREGRLLLRLTPVSVSGRRRFSASNLKPDEQGALRLGPVQPGDYELALVLGAPGHRNVPVSKSPIAVRSGDQTARLAIPELHQLTITWTGEGKPQLSLRPADPNLPWVSHSARVGADGTAVFRDLPPGEYTVRAPGPRRPGSRPKISIPKTKELSLP